MASIALCAVMRWMDRRIDIEVHLHESGTDVSGRMTSALRLDGVRRRVNSTRISVFALLTIE